MKSSSLFLAAVAGAVSAQDLNADCLAPNGNYCVGASLTQNIIIRCDANQVAMPGNCNDNLAGEPPLGVNPALCWQSSPTAGDATCEKNCVVYLSSGPSTLPADQCTPTFTASSAPASSTPSSAPASSTTAVSTSVSSAPASSSTTASSAPASSAPASSTVTTTTMLGSSVVVSTSVVTSTVTGGGGGGGGGGGVSNSTITSGSASKSPVPPTTTSSHPGTVPTGAADATRVGSALALAVGLVAAYML